MIDLNGQEYRIYGGQLPHFWTFLELQLESYKKFIVDTEKYLQDEQKKIDDQIQNKIDTGYDEDHAHNIHELDQMYLVTIADVHRSSQLISLFAFLESHMKELCDLMAEDINQSIKIQDLKGSNYLEQGKFYFKKVLQIDFKSDVDWKKIKDYQVIRNCIVHRNSNFKTSGKPYNEQKDFQSFKNLGIDNFRVSHNCSFYIAKNKILLDFCDLQMIFFKELIGILDDQFYSNR